MPRTRRPLAAALEPATGEVLRERPHVHAGRLLEVVKDRLAQAERDELERLVRLEPAHDRVARAARDPSRSGGTAGGCCHHAIAPLVRTTCGRRCGAVARRLDHDRRDVVAAATAQRELDQIARDMLRRIARAEHVLDRLGRRVAVEPVGAQQHAIAGLRARARRGRPRSLGPRAEVARQHVLVRMALGLVGASAGRDRRAPRRSCDRASASAADRCRSRYARLSPTWPIDDVRRIDDQAARPPSCPCRGARDAPAPR